MHDRFEVSVTFDSAKGYVARVPDLAEPITALSLAVLRRRIEERLLPDLVDVRLVLDRSRQIYALLGSAESYSHAALYSASCQARAAKGCMRTRPDLDFLAAEWLPAIAATGPLAANIIARMAAPARLDGGGSLSVDVTGGH